MIETQVDQLRNYTLAKQEVVASIRALKEFFSTRGEAASAEQFQERVGVLEIFLIAIAIVRQIIVGALPRFGLMPKGARAHLGVERAKEQVGSSLNYLQRTRAAMNLGVMRFRLTLCSHMAT